jgi:hypothetical protein
MHSGEIIRYIVREEVVQGEQGEQGAYGSQNYNM